MSWSYSGDPGASNLDALRFLIGDTDSTASLQQFSDEELLYLLRLHGDSVNYAGIAACHRQIAKFSRYVDQKTGDIDIKYSQKIGQLNSLISSIREGMTPAPYMGGISNSDVENVEDDDDRSAPLFAVGMMDNPTDTPSNTGGTGGVI